MKPLTIKELRSRFNKEKPKFIGLQNDRGQWAVPMNSPAIKPEARMKQIEAFFAKDSTPDGIYTFIDKDTLHINAPENVTQVAKGDVRNLPAVAERPNPAQQVRAQVIDQVWDSKTALEKNTEIIRMTFQIEILQEQNERLTKRVRELEAEAALELGEDEQEGKTDTKELMDGFKSIMETITPVVDRHFELREKELSIKQQALIGRPAGSVRGTVTRELQQTASMRGDGGVPVNDPGYEQYFANVMENAPQELLDLECEYLESVSPELYQTLWDKYNPEEAEDDGSST